MTCVVGLVSPFDGSVWLGSDQCTRVGDRLFTTANPKVFERDGVLFGLAGPVGGGVAARHRMEVPSREPGEDADKYIMVRVYDAIWKAQQEQRVTSKNDEGEYGCSVLIGYAGCVYHFDSYGMGSRCKEGYFAIGSGAAYALGALYVMPGVTGDDTARARVRGALTAATAFDDSCHGDYDIISLPGERVGCFLLPTNVCCLLRRRLWIVLRSTLMERF